jgi:hypothetical protein
MFCFISSCKLESQQLLLINTLGTYIKIDEEANQMNIGIIDDESNVDVLCAPFRSQSFRQVIPPLLIEDIID